MSEFFETIGMVTSCILLAIGGTWVYLAFRIALCEIRRRLGVKRLRDLYAAAE